MTKCSGLPTQVFGERIRPLTPAEEEAYTDMNESGRVRMIMEIYLSMKGSPEDQRDLEALKSKIQQAQLRFLPRDVRREKWGKVTFRSVSSLCVAVNRVFHTTETSSGIHMALRATEIGLWYLMHFPQACETILNTWVYMWVAKQKGAVWVNQAVGADVKVPDVTKTDVTRSDVTRSDVTTPQDEVSTESGNVDCDTPIYPWWDFDPFNDPLSLYGYSYYDAEI
jgi:hypothetical protein